LITVIRLLVVAAASVLVFTLGGLGLFGSLDRILGDARYSLLNRPASGDVVFVEIDSKSLAQVGVWPWPRQIHAQILDKLMEMGARDVAFDIDFSSRSTEEGDAALEAALRRAGGFTYLAAFGQRSGASGELVFSRPLPRFAAEAEQVLVNVATDRQGMVEGLPAALRVAAGEQVVALPVALSGAAVSPPMINIDYGIDAASIERIPVGDVLAGWIDPSRIAGKQVIVGAGALELRDIFAVPRYGFIPGPLIQALATESLIQGRDLRAWGSLPGLAIALLLPLLFAITRRQIGLPGAAVVTLTIMVGAEAVTLVAYGQFGILVETGAFHVSLLTMLTLHVVFSFLAEYAGRMRAQARLAYLAQHDEVTGLLSRRGLIEMTSPGVKFQTIVAIQILRLDLVRGALGQEIHDRALKLLGERLDRLDLGRLALIGEDRFALAVPEQLGEPELHRIVQRVRSAIEPELAIDGHVVHADLASGAACTGDGPAVLLARAELSLSQALQTNKKSPGRFVPELEVRIDRRRRMDAGLRRALAEGSLRVVYQPQIRLSDGSICGVEALVRWHDEELGTVSPADFIPLAEESGLIVPLGAFVLLEACREVAAWQWDGKLAVNVSPAQVQLTDVAMTVDAALSISGLRPQQLDVEITESLLVDNTGRTDLMVSGLRERGVGIAIDDFGTGYSSLSYLSTFAFDKLKVDQSFVRTLSAGSAQADVIHSIIDLAQKLGKQTVAEGIETEEQRRLLARMGCTIGQGYLFGRPMAASDLAAMLEQRKAG
jgi:diguanylate cyclase